MSGPLPFALSPENIYYRSLPKIQQLAATGMGAPVRETGGSLEAGGSLGPDFGLSGGGRREWKEATAPLETPTDVLRQLPAVVQNFSDVRPVEGTRFLFHGQWCSVDSPFQFGLMYADSTRDSACLVWFASLNVGEFGFGRWLALTGTHDQNWVETWTGKFPSNRSGSGTDSFFRLFADASQAEKTTWPSDHACVEAVSSMMGMGGLTAGWSQGLFQVLHVVAFPERGYKVPSRTGKSVDVTQLVIGTPLFMQTATPRGD